MEDVFDWKLGVFTTNLAAGDRKMRVGIAGQFSGRTAQAKFGVRSSERSRKPSLN
jgi:hypothetical protein